MGNKYHDFVQNYSKEHNLKYSEAQKIIKEKKLYQSKTFTKKKREFIGPVPKVQSLWVRFD